MEGLKPGESQIINTLEVIKSPPKHCKCCGMKSDTELKGRFKTGPYEYVCEKCYNYDFVWYDDKDKTPFIADDLKPGKIITDTFKHINQRIERKVLLVEPDYYTNFPPLGLLKLASFHWNNNDTIKLLRIKEIKKNNKNNNIDEDPYKPPFDPDIIHVTSLFTWAWESVWDAVRYYRRKYPKAEVFLGGIYASILPDHAALSGANFVQEGLIQEIEDYVPDYDLIPEWDGNIIFATRGCIRRCSFCVVPKIEGIINNVKDTIVPQLTLKNKRVFFWDNNILAAPNFRQIMQELERYNFTIDFNQGIDARLVTPEIAQLLKKFRIPILHLAYDTISAKKHVKLAIEYLKDAGFNGRKLIFYTLYNFKDTPEDFFRRLKDLMKWGVVSYPMRFEPLSSLKKNQYVGTHWTAELLEMIATARRVIGFRGAFPPYEGLVNKIRNAKDLREAMELEPQ